MHYTVINIDPILKKIIIFPYGIKTTNEVLIVKEMVSPHKEVTVHIFNNLF